MKKIYQNNKQIIVEILIFSLIVISLYIIMNIMGYTTGRNSSDFLNQHIRFIDYLRNSFWSTKDLLPQATFNFGSSQSMANLFYYGQYNPLVMLSYLFPGISTMYWLQIMNITLIISTFIGMNLLLKKLKVERVYVLVFSVLCAFSPSLIYHFSQHIMFIYYYPIFIFSLIAIIKLIDNKIKWPFILCVALIFFTNFFFALVIGFLQLSFFISYLFFISDKTKKEKYNRLIILFVCYIIGILMGMMMFIPQAIPLLSGSRGEIIVKEIPFFYSKIQGGIITDPYVMGIGIFIFFAIVISLLNYKNKFNLVLAIVCLVMISSGHLNLVLNIFQYLHGKVYIYAIPIVFIIIACNLNNNTIKKNIIALFISLLLLVIVVYFSKSAMLKVKYSTFFYIYILCQVLLIISLSFKRQNKVIVLIATIMLVISTLLISVTLVKKDVYKKSILNIKYHKNNFYNNNKKTGFYRDLNYSNYVGAINEYNPAMYTSVISPEYFNFFNKFINVELYRYGRNVKSHTFDNMLMEKLFAVDYKFDKKNENKVRPFIFGVEDKYVYSDVGLNKLKQRDRLIALNNRVFVSDSTKKYEFHSPNIILIKEFAKNYSNKKNHTFVVDLPAEYRKPGVIIIESKVVSPKVKIAIMEANKHQAYFEGINFYNEPKKRNNTIYLNANKLNDKLKIKMSGSNNVYDSIKVSYISKEEIENNEFNYISPSSEAVKYNKTYSFNINMPTNGYLATSIFYDKGYTIKVDGKKTSAIKLNNSFLGSKLQKGSHKIEIGYEMTGFKIGLALSFIGLFIFSFIIIDEVKFFNRPFFRFVLVGVFNTVNYFVMYQILLVLFPYLFAHILAFIYSAFCSYFITTIYTFKTRPAWKTFIVFPITYLPNLLMSTFGTMFLVELQIIDKSIASLIMMLAAIPITFIINRIIFINKDK